jgi:hypothetical protein
MLCSEAHTGIKNYVESLRGAPQYKAKHRENTQPSGGQSEYT